jgi:hypothetical protein
MDTDHGEHRLNQGEAMTSNSDQGESQEQYAEADNQGEELVGEHETNERDSQGVMMDAEMAQALNGGDELPRLDNCTNLQGKQFTDNFEIRPKRASSQIASELIKMQCSMRMERSNSEVFETLYSQLRSTTKEHTCMYTSKMQDEQVEQELQSWKKL